MTNATTTDKMRVAMTDLLPPRDSTPVEQSNARASGSTAASRCWEAKCGQGLRTVVKRFRNFVGDAPAKDPRISIPLEAPPIDLEALDLRVERRRGHSQLHGGAGGTRNPSSALGERSFDELPFLADQLLVEGPEL